jgi:hypothetical protein
MAAGHAVDGGLDFTWDEWKDAEIETPVTGRISLFDGLPAAHTATRNTLSVNAGAERLFVGEGFVIPLRFGAAWEPQGARSPYTLDTVDYRMLAVGTGYNTNSLKIDAAFQYRWVRFQDGANFGLALGGRACRSRSGEGQPGVAAQAVTDPAHDRHGQAPPDVGEGVFGGG